MATTSSRSSSGTFHTGAARVLRPSLCNNQVGYCVCSFGACSAFTHVMAYTLAESPSDPLHRKLRQHRCLCCRFDCYRVERWNEYAAFPRLGLVPLQRSD